MCYFGWHQQVRMSYLPGNQVKSAEKDDVPAYAAFVYSMYSIYFGSSPHPTKRRNTFDTFHEKIRIPVKSGLRLAVPVARTQHIYYTYLYTCICNTWADA